MTTEHNYKAVMRYRLCQLIGQISGTNYVHLVHTISNAEYLETQTCFVRWIGDWVELEVSP